MLRERGQTSTTSKNLTVFKLDPTSSNISQHIATGWPNVCNMLCPTMLQDVALKCCERLARPLWVSQKLLFFHKLFNKMQPAHFEYRPIVYQLCCYGNQEGGTEPAGGCPYYNSSNSKRFQQNSIKFSGKNV